MPLTSEAIENVSKMARIFGVGKEREEIYAVLKKEDIDKAVKIGMRVYSEELIEVVIEFDRDPPADILTCLN